MLNYKGMFYKEEKEKKFYEGGAHFKYSSLVRALLELQNQMKSSSETINSNSEKNDSVFETNNIYRIKDNNNIINKDININQYILTLNNRKDKTFHNKGPLSTEKNLREKAKKKNLIDLLNLNLKIFPIKNNSNSKRKNYIESLDKNYRIKSIKQLCIINNNDNNNNISNRTNKYIKTQINHEKKEYNYDLPLIQSYYFNNLANKSIFEKNKDNNNGNNLKISMFSPMKLRLSKNNKKFPKNPMVSPKKQIYLGNSLLINEIETNKNSKNFETIEMSTNRHYFEKINKMLKSNKSKQKRINNIDLLLYNN